MDIRQEKWLKDKLQWLFGFVQLESEPFGEYPHWYKGVPAYVIPDNEHKEYRTVFMTEADPPTRIDEWRFQTQYFPARPDIICMGRQFGAHGLVEAPQTVEVPKYPSGTYKVCPYCEERVGAKHGKVHLDGNWTEVVYYREIP